MEWVVAAKRPRSQELLPNTRHVCHRNLERRTTKFEVEVCSEDWEWENLYRQIVNGTGSRDFTTLIIFGQSSMSLLLKEQYHEIFDPLFFWTLRGSFCISYNFGLHVYLSFLELTQRSIVHQSLNLTRILSKIDKYVHSNIEYYYSLYHESFHGVLDMKRYFFKREPTFLHAIRD